MKKKTKGKVKEESLRGFLVQELQKWNLECLYDLRTVKSVDDFQNLIDTEKIYIMLEFDFALYFYTKSSEGLVNVIVTRSRERLDDIDINMYIVSEETIDKLVEMSIS